MKEGIKTANLINIYLPNLKQYELFFRMLFAAKTC